MQPAFSLSLGFGAASAETAAGLPVRGPNVGPRGGPLADGYGKLKGHGCASRLVGFLLISLAARQASSCKATSFG